MRRFFLAIIGIIFILEIQIQSTGCANIVPPAGGPRDSIPPVLLRVNPADSSTNFNSNRITFTFDEYIQVENFAQNVTVSPIPTRAPDPLPRLNTITIRLRDSLEPNTTYSINFGDAIKDVNEGNLLSNFTYVFSTGPYIDSLTFSGNVLLAESGKVDSTLTVMLHTTGEDSAVFKERPRYVTKLDGKGNFIFRNLPADTFYVYALKDEGRSMRYMRQDVLFAFADTPVVVQPATPKKTLYAYAGAKRPVTPTGSTAPNVKDRRLKYSTTISNNQHDLLKKFSFDFERPLQQFDSTKIHLVRDTTYTPVRGYSWSIDSTEKIVTLNYSFQENTLYHLIMEKDFATDTLNQQLLRGDTLSFNTLKNTNYGKVSIRFRGLDLSRNLVLQFVQAESVVSSFPMTGDSFSRDLFLPGEYELRILLDDNRNGVWDPGEFFGKRKQPERVLSIERKVNIKENWENEFEINL